MDFQVELGDTLDATLREFRNKRLCPEDFIRTQGVKSNVTKKLFFALYRRDYIENLEQKTYTKPAEIELSDFFTLSVEGRDYIELHEVWWRRFWFRSVGCPIVVSFVTALNAHKIWNSFELPFDFAIIKVMALQAIGVLLS